MTDIIKVVHCTKEPFDVYIGRRPNPYIIKHIKGPCSGPYKWANPFVMDDERKGIKRDGTRAEVISKYREWLLSNKELLAQLHELKGKVLGCWCKPNYDCHGDFLIELTEAIDNKK